MYVSYCVCVDEEHYLNKKYCHYGKRKLFTVGVRAVNMLVHLWRIVIECYLKWHIIFVGFYLKTNNFSTVAGFRQFQASEGSSQSFTVPFISSVHSNICQAVKLHSVYVYIHSKYQGVDYRSLNISRPTIFMLTLGVLVARTSLWPVGSMVLLGMLFSYDLVRILEPHWDIILNLSLSIIGHLREGLSGVVVCMG